MEPAPGRAPALPRLGLGLVVALLAALLGAKHYRDAEAARRRQVGRGAGGAPSVPPPARSAACFCMHAVGEARAAFAAPASRAPTREGGREGGSSAAWSAVGLAVGHAQDRPPAAAATLVRV